MRKYTLKQLCEELSISTATGRNWIKLDKIEPEYIDGKPMFSQAYVDEMRSKLASGESHALKSRRNKKYISGQELYDGYISEKSVNLRGVREIVSKFKECCEASELVKLLAYYAMQLGEDRGINLYMYRRLIGDMTGDMCAGDKFAIKYSWVKDYKLVYNDGEDILGLLYISCKHIGERKAAGAYYTPTKIVGELVSNLWEESVFDTYRRCKVLDPSCGTGNFLLRLPKYIGIGQIYGTDIDAISVAITRLNLALKYNPEKAEILYKNIQCTDYLKDYAEADFDYIIGNPPWGYDFSNTEKRQLKMLYRTAESKGVESYDVFVEKSLKILREGGKVAFVLPEAIMMVKSHRVVRELIMEQSHLQQVIYLGETFHDVQCPSVILQMEKAGEDETGQSRLIRVKKENQEYRVNLFDRLRETGFELSMKDDEYSIIKKLFTCNYITLEERATFGMGIVTGNNRKYISKIQEGEREPVIVGKDVEKYYIAESKQYIKYEPMNLQQVAPKEVYRAEEKLVYRFIGDKLRFAYDHRRRLTLNSCNIVIPRIDGVHIKYILAILNSSVADFLYRKKYRSLKVLRSHIESIPIPMVSDREQQHIVEIVERLEKISQVSYGQDKEAFYSLYESLDACIASLFGLNDEEYQLIKG